MVYRPSFLTYNLFQYVFFILAQFTMIALHGQPVSSHEKINFYKANHPYFQYTGRVDFSDPAKPRYWSAGVYIKAKFKGDFCEILLNDEILYGTYHNYIELVVDNEKPVRLQTTGRTNTITIPQRLSDKLHTVTIYKNTEDGIGYLEFTGMRCRELLPLPPKPGRKIECIGNSITCGMSSDVSQVPCGKGQWYDQHNAYMSYGMITARTLNAQVHLSAVSGIGLIHSCCNLPITMPQIFDNMDLRTGTKKWNSKNYQPDVVTICLGQNDGVQDSASFCSAYVRFIKRLRNYYPKATIVCLTSPMGDETLTTALKKYLSSVVTFANKNGDKKVYHYFFSKRYHNGCGSHPDINDHLQIANELTKFIKTIMKW
jgi:Carbohydrate esterase 2 N-terminal/GDSL-like Lipase/Acylhydrolase family